MSKILRQVKCDQCGRTFNVVTTINNTYWEWIGEGCACSRRGFTFIESPKWGVLQPQFN